MLVDVVLVAAGLGLLSWAADQFVMGAARLSAVLRVAPVVIGAVVIGFGTSSPELMVSALAAAQGELDIAVGNVIGSNVVNLTLILGVAALIMPLGARSRIFRRELPLMLVASVAFAIAVQDGLTRLEGVLLLIGIAGTTTAIVWRSHSAPGDEELAQEVEEFIADGPPAARTEALRTAAGLLGTLAGAQALVSGATGVAAGLGLAEGFIGLTLVALGTSLPELVTAIAAARRSEDELVVGNLLGSNVYNAFAVGGVAAVVGPGALVDPTLSGMAVVLMIAVALVASAAMLTRRQVDRWEGALLIAVYAACVPLLAA